VDGELPLPPLTLKIKKAKEIKLQLIDSIFDDYSRKARLYPAFLALLPPFVILAGYTDWLEPDVSNVAWMLFAAAGLFLLADLTRQRGKSIERRLLSEWGGYPSQTLLRHSDPTFDKYTTDRLHRAAEQICKNVKLPNKAEEEAAGLEADEVYKSVNSVLLPLTHDKVKFPIIYKENVTYGFRRNMLGLKPVSITIALLSIAFILAAEADKLQSVKLPDEAGLISLCVSFVALLCWVFFVSKDHVRTAAHDYGRQMLLTLDVVKKLPQ
jgi:hypothetical protein